MNTGKFIILTVLGCLAGIVKSNEEITVTSCGDPDQALIKLLSFDYSPKPISLPGNITFSIETEVLEDLVAPIKVDLSMDLVSHGRTLSIPCINGMGSCSHDDICPTLAAANCPAFITDNGYSCDCPWAKGQYTISDATINIPIGSSSSGSYHAQILMYSNNVFAMCVDIRIKF